MVMVDPDSVSAVPLALGKALVEFRGSQDPSLSEGPIKMFPPTISVPIPPYQPPPPLLLP